MPCVCHPYTVSFELCGRHYTVEVRACCAEDAKLIFMDTLAERLSVKVTC